MRKTALLSIFVVAVIIGVLSVSQLKLNIPSGSLFPADVLEAREDLIKSFVDEQALLQKQITALSEEITKQQQNNEAILSKTKLTKLDELKLRLGLIEGKGKGIELLLDDSPNAKRDIFGEVGEGLVQAADLRDIVNVLRSTNAEAISINNQRVISTSGITAVGNSILVNNFYLSPPFVITAIGDAEYFAQKLTDGDVLASLKARAVQNQIPLELRVPRSTLIIPAYTGKLETNFLISKESI